MALFHGLCPSLRDTVLVCLVRCLWRRSVCRPRNELLPLMLVACPVCSLARHTSLVQGCPCTQDILAQCSTPRQRHKSGAWEAQGEAGRCRGAHSGAGSSARECADGHHCRVRGPLCCDSRGTHWCACCQYVRIGHKHTGKLERCMAELERGLKSSICGREDVADLEVRVQTLEQKLSAAECSRMEVEEAAC